MAKRRTYFRIRRIAAAELLRLDAAGEDVHADALEWARMTIDGIDDVGGRPPAKVRTAILALLDQHPLDGQTPEQVAAALGSVTVKTMQNVLYNLRQQGQCAAVKSMGRAIYFPNDEAADAQRPRFERERQATHEAARNKRAAAAKADYEARHGLDGSASVEAAPLRRAKRSARAASADVPAAGGKADVTRPASSRGSDVEIIYPANVKEEKRATPKALIDRFGVDDPQKLVPGGFREEWLKLRAGGAEA